MNSDSSQTLKITTDEPYHWHGRLSLNGTSELTVHLNDHDN